MFLIFTFENEIDHRKTRTGDGIDLGAIFLLGAHFHAVLEKEIAGSGIGHVTVFTNQIYELRLYTLAERRKNVLSGRFFSFLNICN